MEHKKKSVSLVKRIRGADWFAPLAGSVLFTAGAVLFGLLIQELAANIQDLNRQKAVCSSPLLQRITKGSSVIDLGDKVKVLVVGDKVKAQLEAIRDAIPLHLINPDHPATQYRFITDGESGERAVQYTTSDEKTLLSPVKLGSVIWYKRGKK